MISSSSRLVALAVFIVIMASYFAAGEEVFSYGSKVITGDLDELRPLNPFIPPNNSPVPFVYVDANQPPGIGPEDPVYLHFDPGKPTIGGDDVRITAFDIYPAGSQVKIGDIDFGYTWASIGLIPRFFDVNGDGFYSFEDPVYLDRPTLLPPRVSSGDIRLTSYLGYSAGSWVKDGETDNGVTLSAPLGILEFYNANGNLAGPVAIYDHGDSVYLDVNPFGVVSVNDVRMSI